MSEKLNWVPGECFTIEGECQIPAKDWGFVAAHQKTGGSFIARSCGFTRDELFPVNTLVLLNAKNILDDGFLVRKIHSYEIDAETLRSFCTMWKYAQSRDADDWLSQTYREVYVDVACRYHLYSDVIKQVFPGAKRVLLHRHPLDRVRQLTQGTWVPEEWFFHQIVEYQLLIDAGYDYTLKVDYKDLLLEPVGTCVQILNHFGLQRSINLQTPLDPEPAWDSNPDLRQFVKQLEREDPELCAIIIEDREASVEQLQRHIGDWRERRR